MSKTNYRGGNYNPGLAYVKARNEQKADKASADQLQYVVLKMVNSGIFTQPEPKKSGVLSRIPGIRRLGSYGKA